MQADKLIGKIAVRLVYNTSEVSLGLWEKFHFQENSSSSKPPVRGSPPLGLSMPFVLVQGGGKWKVQLWERFKFLKLQWFRSSYSSAQMLSRVSLK